MLTPGTTVERDGRAAVVHLNGDLVVSTARAVLTKLRGAARRREVRKLVLDFSRVGRIDSAGLAVVSLIGKQLAQSGKQLELDQLGDQHRAALELVPKSIPTVAPAELPGYFERFGEAVLQVGNGVTAFGRLLAQTGQQLGAVLARRKRLQTGALVHQISAMGVDALFIVGLMSFLTGMTMAFQGAVQLQRFGAGVFVADMISVAMVRELAPLMTAVIITGRTGAAIAAELGTMRVRSEIDALTAMGIDPVRFLVVPRILGITVIGPALTLMGMFIGILGGMLVATMTIGISPLAFWSRVVDRVTLGDFTHGMVKSLVFAWIIGFTGCHLGMRASGDASGVGSATTRTVVASVFLIVMVDAVFATATTLMGGR